MPAVALVTDSGYTVCVTVSTMNSIITQNHRHDQPHTSLPSGDFAQHVLPNNGGEASAPPPTSVAPSGHDGKQYPFDRSWRFLQTAHARPSGVQVWQSGVTQGFTGVHRLLKFPVPRPTVVACGQLSMHSPWCRYFPW